METWKVVRVDDACSNLFVRTPLAVFVPQVVLTTTTICYYNMILKKYICQLTKTPVDCEFQKVKFIK